MRDNEIIFFDLNFELELSSRLLRRFSPFLKEREKEEKGEGILFLGEGCPPFDPLIKNTTVT